MSLDVPNGEERPISSIDELVGYFRSAERPREAHLIGLEHEKLLFRGAEPVPYQGPGGVEELLSAVARSGYQEFREAPGRPVIALTRDGAVVSLEPGGQLELSGSPKKSAREAHGENLHHLAEVEAAARALGLTVAALGYRPFGTVAAMPWMPKTRYRVMRQSLGSRGALAFDMMLMTATGQVSVDFADEADCARKLTLVARVTPLLVALYANSPIVAGKPSGYLSYRSHVWSAVDPARCGYQPWMLDGSFSYEKYVGWALDAPMLFLRRGAEYLDVRVPFRELLARGHEGRRATHSDWSDHVSTLFPEVRVKRVIEVRGADSVPAPLTAALAALVRGLLYDAAALAEAEALLPKLSFEAHLELHEEARRLGLEGRLGNAPLFALARELVEISRRGLLRLDAQDAPLLEPLAEVAQSGRSPARRVLEAFQRSPGPAAFVAGFPP